MQLAAMIDDQQNDVWVSCRYGNGTSFGKFGKFVTFTVPINSSLELARFKPSQPLMMSSDTSKCPKTMQFGAIFAPNCINSSHDSAEQKLKRQPSMFT